MKNANHGRINRHDKFDPTKGKDEKTRGDTTNVVH